MQISDVIADMLTRIRNANNAKHETVDIPASNLYVSCVNHILKNDSDNQTIGILICKNKDNVLAKYAVETQNEPVAISEYELSKLFPKDFKSSMPTIEEIERELK